MKITNLIRVIIFSILGLYASYCSYLFLATPLHPTYLDCGVVKSKSNDEVVIKYGTSTELYLNVQFEKAGFKSVKVSETTYFGNKVGEKVCFDLDIEVPLWVVIHQIIGVLILFCLSVVGFVLICVFLFNWD